MKYSEARGARDEICREKNAVRMRFGRCSYEFEGFKSRDICERDRGMDGLLVRTWEPRAWLLAWEPAHRGLDLRDCLALSS